MLVKRILLFSFSGIFVLIATFFFVRWVNFTYTHQDIGNGLSQTYVFDSKSELQRFENLCLTPCSTWINDFQNVISNYNDSSSGLEGIFDIVKVIGMGFLLPFRVVGGAIIWVVG